LKKKATLKAMTEAVKTPRTSMRMSGRKSPEKAGKEGKKKICAEMGPCKRGDNGPHRQAQMGEGSDWGARKPSKTGAGFQHAPPITITRPYKRKYGRRRNYIRALARGWKEQLEKSKDCQQVEGVAVGGA